MDYSFRLGARPASAILGIVAEYGIQCRNTRTNIAFQDPELICPFVISIQADQNSPERELNGLTQQKKDQRVSGSLRHHSSDRARS